MNKENLSRMFERVPRSLHLRQARVAVAIALLLGFGFAGLQIGIDMLNERKQINHTYEQSLEAFEESAFQAAFGLDRILAETVVSGLSRNEAVFEAVLLDNFGDILASSSRPQKEGAFKWLTDGIFGEFREFSIELIGEETNFNAGTLTIKIDTYIIGKTFLERSGLILVSGIFRNLILAFILAIVFYYMVSRPLQHVSSLIKAGRDFVAVPHDHQHDEIGDLVRAHNALSTDRAGAEADRQAALYKAEEANRSKTAFLAMMSHELRTPLNAILGFSDLIRDGGTVGLKPPKVREYAQDIHTSGEHLLALVNDILDVSAIEIGNRELTKTVVDIAPILQSCAKGLGASAARKDIEIATDAEPGLPSVVADERSMTQIVQNLLSNAVKFTDRNGRIVVAARAEDGSMIIAVEDSGRGIAADQVPEVVKPFVQANFDPHLANQGAGLGLSIVKSLAEAHDGTLSIQSELGVGTVVTVRIPLEARAEEPFTPEP